MGQSYFNGIPLNGEITKDTKTVPIRQLLPFVLFLFVMCVALSLWTVSLLTEQRLVSLDESSSEINGRGRWATLSADKYTVLSYIGEEKIEFTTTSHKNSPSTVYYKNMYIYRIQVNGTDPYQMYIMVTGNKASVYKDGKVVNLCGQCFPLRESMPNIGVVPAYLRDIDEPPNQYTLSVVFAAVLAVVCGLAGVSVLCSVTKRNAEVHEWRKKHGYE